MTCVASGGDTAPGHPAAALSEHLKSWSYVSLFGRERRDVVMCV